MGVRRQAREAAVQALFMFDFHERLNKGRWDASEVPFFFEHFSIPKAARTFAIRLCTGVCENLAEVDEKITCASENWSLSRMARVDRSILRLATFEIAHFDEVPINVAINEAIEVAKRFGADESPVFVNGVLDRVASNERREQLEHSGLEVEVITKPRAQKGTTIQRSPVAVDELNDDTEAGLATDEVDTDALA